MFFSSKIKRNHHLQGNAQVHNVRIPDSCFSVVCFVVFCEAISFHLNGFKGKPDRKANLHFAVVVVFFPHNS